MENIAPVGSAERFDDEILPEETWNINESGVSNVQYINDSGPKSLSEDLSKDDVLDGSALRTGEWTAENTHKLGHLGGFWRTDSWESVSSNASLFSLTERVEFNRTNLKRMLTSSQCQCGPGIGIESPPQESLAPTSCQFQPSPLDDSFSGNKYIKQGCEIGQNDSDWDSGISLQESDRGMRAFVSSNQLPLSPRHELAKQLLERARMKARASPLKADHSILPVVKSSVEIGTKGTPSPKKGPFSREECSSSTQNSCNLSDSSSGESRCGLRKKRSQSPSHVRFEDESTQEAEVRYQLRRKCGLESSVRQIPRGLTQEHGLPSYGTPEKEYVLRAESRNYGKPFHKNTGVIGSWSWKSGPNPVATGETGENPLGKASSPHFNTAICIDGKCSCCGSYIISSTKAICLDPPSYEFPDASVLHQGREPQRPSHHELPMSIAKEVQNNFGVEAPDVGVLPPRIVPCWVLPSQHRIRIEPIKETYIGEITSIDDVSVTDGNTTNTAFEEMKDCREPKIPMHSSATMPGSNEDSTNCIELNAKGTGMSTKCIGENSFEKEPRRSRMSNSRSMNTSFPTKFEENTSDQDPLPKRPVINKANLTILSNSQQNKLPLTQKNNPLTNLDTCPSPQYRLIHLNPEENDGRPSNSQTFPDMSLLQSQQSPSGPNQQLPNGHTIGISVPLANRPLSSAIQLVRNNNGDDQSSEGYRSEVGKNSEMSKQITNISDGLLSSEHKTSIKLTENQNCLIDPTHATVSSSKQSTEKRKDRTESQSATVKTQPQDITSSGEPVTPVPTLVQEEHNSLPKPPPPAARDGEPLLPGIGAVQCGDKPIHNPASKSSDDNQLPFTSQGNSRTQHITDSQHKSRSFMKAFFTSIGQNTVSKLNRLRSSSMEQINCQSTEAMSGKLRCEKARGNLRKTPSLQSLRLASPLAQLRKASSIQLLYSQNKKNRCSSYLVGEMMETGLGSSEPKATGCKSLTSLSVEDIGSPNHPRFIGQVMETFADASFLLQLSKPAHGPFGFFISRSHGGIFIHQMADKNAEKLYSGLLEPGDEILEVNGERVEGLSFNEVNNLMLQDNRVSIRVRRHNANTRQKEH
ncbi:uncharacterized protein LOC127567959 [Pristis pectinata]|uniref:uncharacterized protein LOC127567959 n=1 Tax=Pristis pectinata TaxID=685728 RepID=UPI00223D7ADC|nr:uncharacterized protein LOC127567959 [Pristis pectinata]